MALVLAIMDVHVYSICNLQLFLSILVYIFFNLVLKCRNGQWYQHLLTLFAIFYKSNTELSDYVCMFYVDVMCILFCIVFNLCEI